MTRFGAFVTSVENEDLNTFGQKVGALTIANNAFIAKPLIELFGRDTLIGALRFGFKEITEEDYQKVKTNGYGRVQYSLVVNNHLDTELTIEVLIHRSLAGDLRLDLNVPAKLRLTETGVKALTSEHKGATLSGQERNPAFQRQLATRWDALLALPKGNYYI